MKNKIKFLTLIFIIIFLSGCTMEETVTIETTGVVNEKFNVYADNEYYYFQEAPVTDYIRSVLEPYEVELANNYYDYNVYSNIDISGVEGKREFSNVCDYFEKSLIIKKLYSSVDCIEKGDYYEVNINTSMLSGNYNSIMEEFDNVNFSIETKLNVLSQNANKVKKNVYTWDINDSNVNEGIYIKIAKKEINKSTKNFKSNVFIFKYFTILTIILIGLICITLYSKYKKNKIKY